MTTTLLYKNSSKRRIQSLLIRRQQQHYQQLQLVQQLISSQCHYPVNRNAIYCTTRSVSSSVSLFFSSLSSLVLSVPPVTSKCIPLYDHRIQYQYQHQHYQRLNFSTSISYSNRNSISTTSAKIPTTTETATIPSINESDTKTTSTTTPIKKEKFVLSKPTWSINSLQLHINHEPISYNELKILSKRAVIDIKSMNTTQIQQLQQNVGNMLHMINQVTVLLSNDNESETTNNNTTITMNDDDEEEEIQQLRQEKDLLTTIDLYDIPRGVYAVPLRGDDNNNIYKTVDDTIDKNDALQLQEQQQQQKEQQEKLYKEYENVWTSYLQPNTKRIGSHDYFVIASSASSVTATKSTTKSSTKTLSSSDDDDK